MPEEMWLVHAGQMIRRGRSSLPISTSTFVLRETKPTWDNSGARIPRSSMTLDPTVNYVSSYPGQVISGIYLPQGRFERRHPGVIIEDCETAIGYAPNGSSAGQRLRIQGNPGIVDNPNYDASGAINRYVTIDPVNAGTGGSADDAAVGGIFGYGFTAQRCRIRGVTDAFMPDVRSGFTAPSVIEGNYAETRWLSYDPEQTDGTHNDGVQLTGADGDRIVGNNFVNPAGGVTDPVSGYQVKGQCIVLTPYHGAINNTVIEDNWVSGAYTQIAAWVPTSYGPQPQGITIRRHKHGGRCVWMVLITPAVNTARTDISANIVGPDGIVWNNGARAAGLAADINVTSAG